MHIPDGLINDPKVWLAGDAVALAAVGYAVHRESRSLKPEDVPLMGVMAAFIFAGQMFNVPVAAGVSGLRSPYPTVDRVITLKYNASSQLQPSTWR